VGAEEEMVRGLSSANAGLGGPRRGSGLVGRMEPRLGRRLSVSVPG
jgi:hypothetical protein